MVVTLDIIKNVYGGDGMARLGDGRVCFVPGVFTGETIKAKITEEKRNFTRAELVEILTPSPDRIDPPNNVIPGMVYAGVSPEAEMRFKTDQLENFLWKIQQSLVPLEVRQLPNESFYNYRNKAVYHVDKQDGKWKIGYRKEPFHEIVDVTEDPLALPGINAMIPIARSSVMSLLTQGAYAVRKSAARSATNVTIRWTQIDGGHWWFGDAPANLELREQTAGLKFRVAAGGFYQVNHKVGDELVKIVRDIYLSDIESTPHILDLYCGVGVFGITCAKAALSQKVEPRLVGVEADRSAIQCAKKNALDASVKGSFFCERVGMNLRRIKVGKNHTVIIDPPRGGLEKGVPQWLARGIAGRIIYVSCDPATLVRDLVPMMSAYKIEKTILLNMFPRTARFETVCVLTKREASK
jgi:23S rRNA (uracil1939-C5)-methyltransferase/tRNA (uracil-5-)-methyltransferase